MRTTKSICCYCGVGCGIELQDTVTGLELIGDSSHPSSRGRLCSKGRSLLHVVRDRETRLLRPQRRTEMGYVEQDWMSTWDELAERFQAIIAEHGPDSVAFYGSGQSLTEDYYTINKLVKGFIGTNNFDTNSRLCMSAAVVGYKRSLGADAPPCSYADIDECDVFFIAGSNAAWAHPIIFRRIEDRLRTEPNAKLIVVDPRRTATAEQADLHLAVRPGTDVYLYHAIARRLLELGAWDDDFLAAHVDGVEEFKAILAEFDIDSVAKMCDVAAADIEQAAGFLAHSRFLTMWAMGLNQSTSGVAKSRALINLNLITGAIGKPGCGPFSLTGQPNAMGGREVGGMANLNSSHRELANPEHRAEVAAHWGVESVPEKPGRTATEIFSDLEEGKIKAIWVVATNPVASLPNSDQVVRALQAADLVVVQDCFANDTTAFADYILPTATWPEKTGTMTNSERRVALLQQAEQPPGEALPDWRILQGFADAMGFSRGFSWQHESEIFAEHVALTKGRDCDYSGLNYERLKQGTVQWPVPEAGHPGTPRLYTDGKFETANGRAQLDACMPEDNAERCDDDFPFMLTTGRLRDQWHTQTKTGRVAKLRAQYPKPFIQLHPNDAATLNLTEGDTVCVSSRRGEIELACAFDDGLKPGVVFMPMHWGRHLAGPKGATNVLTNPAFDPNSKQPELKFSAVHIAKKPVVKQQLVIIGAGAACLGLIDQIKAEAWNIAVFADEAVLPYDRVQLPHYIDGSRRWSDLQRLSNDDIERRSLAFIPHAVSRVDPTAKCVFYNDDQSLAYDHLVFATGSKPSIPFAGDLPPAGVGGLRTRVDADTIMQELQYSDPVVIVGGGLLGLELAAALRTYGIQDVHVLQRSDRLMGRQLDAPAALILARHMRQLGVQVHFKSALKQVHGDAAVHRSDVAKR